MDRGGYGSVTRVLVGLNEVGIVGLRETFIEADRSGTEGELETILDRIVEIVGARNYVPETQVEDFRRAVAREYLRHRRMDFREYFSRLDVTVRGAPGPDRSRLVENLIAVLADFELEPVVTFDSPADTDDPEPELLILGESVVRGAIDRVRLKDAIRSRISHW